MLLFHYVSHKLEHQRSISVLQ